MDPIIKKYCIKLIIFHDLDQFAATWQVIVVNWAYYKLLDQSALSWQVVVWRV
jgi:hypothetical protein